MKKFFMEVVLTRITKLQRETVNEPINETVNQCLTLNLRYRIFYGC
jgi:hypothetical protein